MNPNQFKNYGQVLRANEAGLQEIRDIHGYHAIEIPLWIVILLGLIILSAAVYFIYIKFFKNKKTITVTPFDIASNALRELDISLGSKEFYLEYAEIVKVYLETELDKHLLDKTTEEFKETLKDNEFLTTGQLLKLVHSLDTADLAKFAKQEISAEKKAEDIETALFSISEVNKKLVQKRLLEEQMKAGTIPVMSQDLDEDFSEELEKEEIKIP